MSAETAWAHARGEQTEISSEIAETGTEIAEIAEMAELAPGAVVGMSELSTGAATGAATQAVIVVSSTRGDGMWQRLLTNVLSSGRIWVLTTALAFLCVYFACTCSPRRSLFPTGARARVPVRLPASPGAHHVARLLPGRDQRCEQLFTSGGTRLWPRARRFDGFLIRRPTFRSHDRSGTARPGIRRPAPARRTRIPARTVWSSRELADCAERRVATMADSLWRRLLPLRPAGEDRLSDDLSDGVSDRLSDRLSDDLSDDLSDRLSDGLSDDLSEDL